MIRRIGGSKECAAPRPRGRSGPRPASLHPLVGGQPFVVAFLAGLLIVGVTVGMRLPSVDAAGGVYVVDSAGDGVGSCSASAPGGTCTLRTAILAANASPGHDLIHFAIPGPGPHQIRPLTALPVITDGAGVTIDGYTQPGSSVNTLAHGSNADIRIELRGTGPGGIDGLYFQSSNNVVRGLALFDFKRHIRFWAGSPSVTADDNEVIGNFIGTNAAGTFGASARTVNANGVHLERSSSNNRIGKPGDQHRNVISGVGDRGVALFDSGTDDNRIQNNLIGLRPDGLARLTNFGHGVDINYNASDNTVGGNGPGEGNVLSGNTLSGVEISHNQGAGQTTGNAVIGNLVGTTPDGNSAPDFARNGEFGVAFEGHAACADSCTPDISGNSATGNVIVGSAANIMIWKGANDTLVADNHLGVLADGSPAASSSSTIWNVLIEAGAFDNRVERNVIAGTRRGIAVRPDNNYSDGEDAAFRTDGNTFSENSIHDIDGGLGIDLYEKSGGGYVEGPSTSPDPLVNGAISYPVVTSATTDRLQATTCANCVVEIFVTPTPTCSNCFSSHGRGKTFVARGTADGSGSVSVDFRTNASDPYVVRAGEQVALHATDDDGNTSEHSLRVTVSAGSIPPPGATTTTTSTSTTTTTTATTTTTTTTTTVPPTTSTTTTTTSTSTTSTTTTSTTTTTTTVPPTTSTTTSTTTTSVPGTSTRIDGVGDTGGARSAAVRCSVSSLC